MRWHAQVLHVARKDARLIRWLVPLFALMVAAATANAVGVPLTWGYAWMLLILLAGPLLFGALIQADAPSEVDAFWATRPLDPLAVFAAKLLLAALVLVGVPVLGELVALALHDVAPAAMPALLGRSVLFYTTVLATAAMVAAVAGSLGLFITLFIVLLMVELVMGQLLVMALGPDAVPSGPTRWHALWGAVGVAGMLLVAAHQYRTRNRRRGMVLVAAMVVLSILVPALLAVYARPAATSAASGASYGTTSVTASEAESTAATVAASGAAAGQPPLILRIARAGVQGGRQLTLQFATAPAAMPPALLRIDDLLVIAGDDTTRLDRTSQPWQVHLSGDRYLGAGLRPELDVTWLLPAEPAPLAHTLRLTRAQADVLVQPDARLIVRGALRTFEWREVARLPAREGAAHTQDGARRRIVAVTNEDGAPTLTVRYSMVPAIPDEHPFDPVEMQTLVNERTREAMPLRRAGGGSHGLGLVLLGGSASVGESRLQAESARHVFAGDPVHISDEWLRESVLLVMRRVHSTSHPVVLEVSGPFR